MGTEKSYVHWTALKYISTANKFKNIVYNVSRPHNMFLLFFTLFTLRFNLFVQTHLLSKVSTVFAEIIRFSWNYFFTIRIQTIIFFNSVFSTCLSDPTLFAFNVSFILLFRDFVFADYLFLVFLHLHTLFVRILSLTFQMYFILFLFVFRKRRRTSNHSSNRFFDYWKLSLL